MQNLGRFSSFVHKTVSQLVLVGLAVTVVLWAPTRSVGQSNANGWAEPIDLTDPLESRGIAPRMAADARGRVHVVWGSWVGPGMPNEFANNTVYYRCWDGENWTDPVDILAFSTSTGGITADSIGVFRDDLLIVTWRSGMDWGISKAPIQYATNAHAWESAVVDLGGTPKLAIDPISERWYVSYEGRERDILFTYSDDRGHTWAAPQAIWRTPVSTSAPTNTSICVANDGSVHMAWAENVERRQWMGEAIWHARLTSAKSPLFTVREVARSVNLDQPTLGSPAMAVGPGGQIHLFWNNGVGSRTGRFHQWSSDNGLTWSDVRPVFPGLSGQTSQAGMVFDSAGCLHMITAAAGGVNQKTALRYTIWRDGVWTPYVTLWSEVYPGERPILIITEGNRLHLVWDLIGGAHPRGKGRAVMYSSRWVDSPKVSSVSIKDSEITSSHSLATPGEPDKQSPTEPTQPMIGPDLIKSPPSDMAHGGFVLLRGLVPVALLVVGVIALNLRQALRR